MPSDCGTTCPDEGGFYGSGRLSIGGNAVLLAVFAVLTPAVLYTGVRFRTPLLSTILATGLVLEVIGFVGRILLHGESSDETFFLLSLIGTVIGPAFITGALISVLPHILSIYGEHLSPFRPVLGGILPGSLQVVAVIVQVVGVVIMALNLTTLGRKGGSHVLTAGLAIQIASLASFIVVHFLFTLGLKTRTAGLDPKHQATYQSARFKRFLLGLWTSTLLLVIHSLYRVIEIPLGINGVLFQNEPAFMVINGALPFLSATLLTVLHPGAAFGSAWGSTSPASLGRRRPTPANLRPSHDYHLQSSAHHRYDPEIRKQISPTSQRHTRQSSIADPVSGSPGLPPNPKAYTRGSPLPSPTGTAGTAGTAVTSEKRLSQKPERKVANISKNMVDSESLW